MKILKELLDLEVEAKETLSQARSNYEIIKSAVIAKDNIPLVKDTWHEIEYCQHVLTQLNKWIMENHVRAKPIEKIWYKVFDVEMATLILLNNKDK